MQLSKVRTLDIPFNDSYRYVGIKEFNITDVHAPVLDFVLLDLLLKNHSYSDSYLSPRSEGVSGMHGPYLLSALVANDFIHVDKNEALKRLDDFINDQSYQRGPSPDAIKKLESVRSLFSRSDCKIYMLKKDVASAEHELSFIIDPFYEFVVISQVSLYLVVMMAD